MELKVTMTWIRYLPFAIVLCAGCGTDAPPSPTYRQMSIPDFPCHLIGTVVEVKQIHQHEGEVFFLHHKRLQPWVIVIEVYEVSEECEFVKAGQEVAFAVHSPAMTLRWRPRAQRYQTGEEPIGLTFKFSIDPASAGGCRLGEAVEIPDPESSWSI